MQNLKPFELKVYHGDLQGFYMTSVIVVGENECMLFDAQLTIENAYKLCGEIAGTDKKLTKIFVMNSDPEFYFALPAIIQLFPDVEIFATPKTIKQIKETEQTNFDLWKPLMGNKIPNHVVLPQCFNSDYIDFEGHKLDILGILNNEDERPYIYIPELKAIIGGINLCGNLHLPLQKYLSKRSRNNLTETLEYMLTLDPDIVIPGHFQSECKFDKSIIISNIEYLKTFESYLAECDNPGWLVDKMLQSFPNYGSPMSLEVGAIVIADYGCGEE